MGEEKNMRVWEGKAREREEKRKIEEWRGGENTRLWKGSRKGKRTGEERI